MLYFISFRHSILERDTVVIFFNQITTESCNRNYVFLRYDVTIGNEVLR